MIVKKFIRKLTFSNNEWEINIGSMLGYEQGNRVFVYPLDENITNESIVLESLSIERCLFRNSILSTSSTLDRDEEYQAIVYNTSYPLAVEFRGESLAVELLQSSLNIEVVANELCYRDLLYEQLNSKYFVQADDAVYHIYKLEEGIEVLLFSSDDCSEKSALVILDKLVFYFYWEQFFNTNNNNEINEMLDFTISYKGKNYTKDFLIVDDKSDGENIFSYNCKLVSDVKEALHLSLLIFDEKGEAIYDGFPEESEILLSLNKTVTGQTSLYFSSEDIKNEVYEKNYFFKLYSSNDAFWASKTIELRMLYATPIEISKDTKVEIYKGIKVKSHDSLVITFLATKELIISKDFNQRASFKPAPNRNLIDIALRGENIATSISEERPLSFSIQGEHNIEVYSSQGNTYHTSYANGVTEVQITSVVEEEDNSWSFLSFFW